MSDLVGNPEDRFSPVAAHIYFVKHFQIIYPVFKKKSLSMPDSCPFIETRDMYNLHETHKTEEAYARWACEFCGKTFYAEQYLDDHLQNRHGDKVLKVCLHYEKLVHAINSDFFFQL